MVAAPEQVADGFIKIAVENMANAIKKISVQRGYDVTRYALNCFGGAGGQHACLVADALGMTKRADSSVLVAPLRLRHGACGYPQRPPAGGGGAVRRKGARDARESGAQTCRHCRERSCRAGRRAGKDQVHVRAHIRYAGTDTALIVDARSSLPWVEAGSGASRGEGGADRTLQRIKAAFERAHKARFGFIDRTKSLVLEAVSVEAVGGGARFKEQSQKDNALKAPGAGAPHALFLRRQMAPCCRLHTR